MSHLAFQARIVSTKHPKGTFPFAGFADSSDAPEKYLLLQRDTDDRSIHLEWCDQGKSGYGLIESAALGFENLDISLTSKGSDLLDGAERINITFSISDQSFQELQNALVQIFHGTDSFKASAA